MTYDQGAAVVRPLANFTPDIWGDYFASFATDIQVMETYNADVDVLKEQVRAMIVAEGTTQPEQLTLIDTVERLGLSYHFEDEIEQLMEKMFRDYYENNNSEYDLFTVALHFRMFRQHGYKLSTDVFKKFTDDNGKFITSLANDTIGMLSLYEAAHLRIHGEDILEEAVSFTRTHLTHVSHDTTVLGPFIEEQVKHALEQSLHRGIQRLEARHYISVYKNHPSKNDILLKLANTDFNRVQMLHKEELGQLARWWKEFLVSANVSYARDRPAESYFWCASTYDEPKYAAGRSNLTKVFMALGLTDDTYDAYGTYEELKQFTHAILRWDISAINELPEYMQPVYRNIINMHNECQMELAAEGRSYAVCYAIEAFKEMVRGYDIETEWLKESYVPTFDDYLVNELTTSMYALHTLSLLGMGENANVEAFEWIATKPKIAIASSLICRLMDDIGGHKDEHQRKHIATGLDCYMKQYNVSKQEATTELYKLVENAWKDINEEMLKPTAVPMDLLKRVLNLSRSLDVIYKFGGDGFTHPKGIKDHVKALYVVPAPM